MITNTNLDKSMYYAMTKLWGGKDMDEISFNDINDVMKNLPALDNQKYENSAENLAKLGIDANQAAAPAPEGGARLGKQT